MSTSYKGSTTNIKISILYYKIRNKFNSGLPYPYDYEDHLYRLLYVLPQTVHGVPYIPVFNTVSP